MSNNILRSTAAITEKKADEAASRAKDRRVVLAVVAILLLATAVAYRDSFNGPFIFDDDPCIADNPTIRHLGAIGAVLSPPGGGITVTGRPVLNLSLAINYALGGTQARGYHLMNFAIHILAGLTLFGIVRRTLLLPSMRDRFGAAAPYLAGAISLLWMVHPLQTESVTYIIQRAESLMGLFYLLVLYCTIRVTASRPVLWSLAAVAACAMGMATKEVMVTAPVIVLLYDRTFVGGSLGQALRKRWGLYAGLFACWGLLAYLMASAGDRGGTAGFGAEDVPDWRSYGLTQFSAIPHYLRLTFWPAPLCLDYGPWLKTSFWEVLPPALMVAALGAATIWFLRRGRKWGFLGAWFLAILAPSSSIVPIHDTVFEHRMYLSLAAAASLVVLGGFLLWRKLTQSTPSLGGLSAARRWAAPGIVVAAAATALAALTVARNGVYQTSPAIWRDTVDQSPANARAHCNLGFALKTEGEYDLAIGEYGRAIGLNPRYALAYSNLGVALIDKGAYDQAIEQFRRAVQLKPRFAEAHFNLGFALCLRGRFQEAVPEFQCVIRLKPEFPAAYNNLGLALESQGKLEDAIAQFRQAIRVDPRFLSAYQNLEAALDKAGRNQEAQDTRRRAAELESASPSP